MRRRRFRRWTGRSRCCRCARAVERRTHDYRRHGTTSLFAALNVKRAGGRPISPSPARARIPEVPGHDRGEGSRGPGRPSGPRQLRDAQDPPDPTVVLKRPRFHVHFTPKSASWLNLVERWFALLTEKQFRRGVHRSTQALRAAIVTYIAYTNDHPKHFVWTNTADEILASVARFCHRISDSGH